MESKLENSTFYWATESSTISQKSVFLSAFFFGTLFCVCFYLISITISILLMWFLSVECQLCSATKELSVASEEISPCAVPLLLFGLRLLAICCCVYTHQRTTVALETFRWTSTQTWRDLPLNSFSHACGFALESWSVYCINVLWWVSAWTTQMENIWVLGFFVFFSCSFCIQLQSTTSYHTENIVSSYTGAILYSGYG